MLFLKLIKFSINGSVFLLIRLILFNNCSFGFISPLLRFNSFNVISVFMFIPDKLLVWFSACRVLLVTNSFDSINLLLMLPFDKSIIFYKISEKFL